MKNNRSFLLESNFLQTHQLSKDAPPADSLFWKMWHACESTVHQVLETPIIKGIKAGTLNPVVYGGFNVSDAYYCFHGAPDYLIAANKAKDPTLKAFLMKKYESYEKYNKTFPKIWRVKNAEGVVPTDACKQYAAFESSIATLEEAIYCLVVMLPCSYLWAWLGEQLSPPTKGNLYAPWINGNNSPGSSYAMGNFLHSYQQKHGIDEAKATKIYRFAMEYELANFLSATED